MVVVIWPSLEYERSKKYIYMLKLAFQSEIYYSFFYFELSLKQNIIVISFPWYCSGI